MTSTFYFWTRTTCNSFSANRVNNTKLYEPIAADGNKLAIIYHNLYDISFMGLQKLHPFDAGKWGRIVTFLAGAIIRLISNNFPLYRR
jgi:hypothetical protein